MNLLDSDEISQLNSKITSFILISPNRVDDDDVDIFVVKPPPPVSHWGATHQHLPPHENDATNTDSATLLQASDSSSEARRDVANSAQARVESMTHLCEICDGALSYVSHYLDILQSKGKEDEAIKDLPTACLLHSCSKTLQDGEDGRCHLCVLLMGNLRVKRLAMESIDQSNIEMCWQSDKPTPTRLHFALTHRGHPRSAKNYWNILKLQLWPSSKFDRALFGMTDEGMERHPSTESVQTCDNALQWLKICQANKDGKHDQCNRSSGDRLPTRLLDVTSAIETSMLKLVEPLDHPDVFVSDHRYITLSHCWGTWGAGQLPVLTTDNISERLKDGLAMALLPKTFADAVIIAHWFKVRWLWIDSLCILQDSQDDWQKEAIMMYDVYKNALLNISADDSPDGRWGCFRNRDPLAVLPMSLRFPGQEDRKFWLTPDTHATFESITDSPLAKRGWVFQERQLSRRVLHFTSHELIWECCAEGSYSASETFPGGTPFKTVFNGKPKFQTQTNLGAMGTSPTELYAAWATICKEYSAKVFSHVQDKLVALSGLAQEFQAAFPNDIYMAGMWRSTLPQSLLWGSSNGSSPVKTTEPYLAPSWSWLAIDGPISPFQPDDTRTPYSLVDIVDVTTTPVFPSKPTASLKHASITIRCFLRPVEIRPDYEKKPWYMLAMGGGKAHKLLIKDEDDGGTESSLVDNFHSDAFHYSFDVESDEDSGPESLCGYFLPLTMSQPTEYHPLCISGLLVEPAEGRGIQSGGVEATYRRVGTLSVYGPHCQRMKYKKKSSSDLDEEEQRGWSSLLECLRVTHQSLEKSKEDMEEDSSDNESNAEKTSSGGGGERGENRSRDEDLDGKLEGLDISGRVGEPDEVTVQHDLSSVKPLERLYALDSALDAELKYRFERLVWKEITLI